MHEVGLVEGIVDTVIQRSGDRPVARVRVHIGTLHRTSPGPMEQAFELVTAGTSLDGATLEIVSVPVVSTCRACGRAEAGDQMALACSGCGEIGMDYSGGEELLLESIEYRAPVGAAASVKD